MYNQSLAEIFQVSNPPFEIFPKDFSEEGKQFRQMSVADPHRTAVVKVIRVQDATYQCKESGEFFVFVEEMRRQLEARQLLCRKSRLASRGRAQFDRQ